MPALRDRREDIPLLIAHFFGQFNSRWNRRLSGLSSRAMDVLLSHQWPGNVRELRNVVEALFASLSPQVSGTVDLPPQVVRHLSVSAGLGETERDKMLKALVATEWNKSKASEQLEWSRMTLYRKMRKHNLPLDPKSFMR
jgi:transcriptional regulator of acetoin/glycerol metabolism